MIRPPWVPPPEVKRDKPYLPSYIKGGAHNNPMGAAALLLGSGKYAIHGTNRAPVASAHLLHMAASGCTIATCSICTGA
jgi:lipoprotein-anchoring transpeptidase ErfK/SrfK